MPVVDLRAACIVGSGRPSDTSLEVEKTIALADNGLNQRVSTSMP
jgi:hypothetical protein